MSQNHVESRISVNISGSSRITQNSQVIFTVHEGKYLTEFLVIVSSHRCSPCYLELSYYMYHT